MDKSIMVLYANSDDFQKERSLEDLLDLLPSTVKERAHRYKFSQDAYNFVLGRLLLKEGLKKMGMSNDILNNIEYSKESKPLLQGIHFNISHSLNLVACAISLHAGVGLDIEFPRNIKKENFKHCFNDKEWSEIIADGTLDTFYKYWTQKEAVLKVNAMGLNRLMDMEILEGGKSAYFYFEEENRDLFCLNNFKIGEAYGCLASTMVTSIDFIEKINPKGLSNEKII